MDDDQQFCLRWNNHQATLISVFDTLLEKGIHVDCTLAAEGQTLKAHKVVLSACSPYFESVLSQQYDKHPIIILKDVKYAELRAMMDYMYRGEVNISQDQLAALLKAAESLQIKGLSDNKPSRPPSHPTPATTNAHPPRSTSPSHQVRDGSVDSREGSTSPSRRRKKARRASTDLSTTASPVVIPLTVPTVVSEPVPATLPADTPAPCKEEGTRDGVEDLTLDEEAEEPPVTSNNDVVRSFAWHMERSQDEMLNSSDGVRDSQDLRKDSHLSSALLSLLTVQHAQTQPLSTLVPPCIQVTNLIKPNVVTKELTAFPAGLHLSKIPLNTFEEMPDNIKAHLLQQAFIQNNNTQNVDFKSLTMKPEDTESDVEYDDTDDILLPEELDTYYGSNESLSPGSGDSSVSATDGEALNVKRENFNPDDVTRHFECRHCGKRYRWKSTLRRHENVECGGKAPSHQCPYCAYKAKQRGNLGVHIRKHHNKEWYIYASNKIRKNKKTPI